MDESPPFTSVKMQGISSGQPGLSSTTAHSSAMAWQMRRTTLADGSAWTADSSAVLTAGHGSNHARATRQSRSVTRSRTHGDSGGRQGRHGTRRQKHARHPHTTTTCTSTRAAAVLCACVVGGSFVHTWSLYDSNRRRRTAEKERCTSDARPHSTCISCVTTCGAQQVVGDGGVTVSTSPTSVQSCTALLSRRCAPHGGGTKQRCLDGATQDAQATLTRHRAPPHHNKHW